MVRKIREIFYLWAYLDLGRTCKKEHTYFGRFAQEIGEKNLSMMRSASGCFLVIGVFGIISSYAYIDGELLRNLYVLISVFEAAMVVFCTVEMKRRHSARYCMGLAAVYLVHVLAIGGYIGVQFSKEEAATVFVVTLMISPIIFAVPQVLLTALVSLATVGTLVASYWVKESVWFQYDVINCVGVLILSLLLGWRINEIRAEEAFARAHALELNAELKRISSTDSLTGLPNHRSFQDSYFQAFQDAKAEQKLIGIVMMDLDKFKAYNDNYGHVEGDECLQAVGKAIADCVGEGVSVYRYGGEEFVAVLSGDACQRAESIAQSFREAVEAMKIPHAFSVVSTVMTLSAGLYVGIPAVQEKPSNLVDRADRAMYDSKQAGGNCLTSEGVSATPNVSFD